MRLNKDDFYQFLSQQFSEITQEDSELLYYAACASDAEKIFVALGSVFLSFRGGRAVREWDPLRSSSDAFELAVHLKLYIDIRGTGVHVAAGGGMHTVNEHAVGSDFSSATRRAITRIAAAVGKKK